MRWLALIPLLTLLVPVAAKAEDKQDRSTARDLVHQGARLYQAEQYREAIAAFEGAYRHQPHFLVQCNIARCHEMLRELSEAAEHYRRCLAEGGADAPIAAEARRALTEVEVSLREQAASRPTLATVPAAPSPPPERAPRWLVLAWLAPALELRDFHSQLKVGLSGVRRLRAPSGPAVGLDLQVSFTGAFATVEVGPRLTWDFLLMPGHGLTIGPSLMVGLAWATERCTSSARWRSDPEPVCSPARTGLSIQAAAEGRMRLGSRAVVTVRPLSIDVLPTEGGGEWALGLRYDFVAAAGVTF